MVIVEHENRSIFSAPRNLWAILGYFGQTQKWVYPYPYPEVSTVWLTPRGGFSTKNFRAGGISPPIPRRPVAGGGMSRSEVCLATKKKKRSPKKKISATTWRKRFFFNPKFAIPPQCIVIKRDLDLWGDIPPSPPVLGSAHTHTHSKFHTRTRYSTANSVSWTLTTMGTFTFTNSVRLHLRKPKPKPKPKPTSISSNWKFEMAWNTWYGMHTRIDTFEQDHSNQAIIMCWQTH